MSIPKISAGSGRVYLWWNIIAKNWCWELWYDISNFTLKWTYNYPHWWWIDFSEDWKLLFLKEITNTNHWTHYKYQLTNPFDLSNGTLLETQYIANTRSNSFNVRDGWNIFFTNDEINDTVKKFTMSTPYTLSTNTLSQNVSAPGWYCYDMFISKDIKHIYIPNWYTNSYIKSYSLSTPWDLSTMQEIWTLTSTQRDYYWPPFINDAWTMWYIFVWWNLYSFTLSTPYDISTIILSQTYISDLTWWIYYDRDWNLFIASWNPNWIYHYKA